MPIIVESPSNMTVFAGESSRFTCKVSKIEVTKIMWLKHYNVTPAHVNASNLNTDYIIVRTFSWF